MLLTLLLAAACAPEPVAPHVPPPVLAHAARASDTGATAGELEARLNALLAAAARGGPVAEVPAGLQELAAAARALGGPHVEALGALARTAGTAARLEIAGAAELRRQALQDLLEQARDDARLAAFLERFGRDNTLAIGLAESERFLGELAARSSSAELQAAARAAHALALFEAADALAPERVPELRRRLELAARERAGTRQGRRATAALFHWDHLRVMKVVPAFRGRTAAGGELDLAELRGRVVLLDFWGETTPTPAELELRRAWRKQHAAAPFTLVVVAGRRAAAPSAQEEAWLARLGDGDEAALDAAEPAAAAFVRARRAEEARRLAAQLAELELDTPAIVDGLDARWSDAFHVPNAPTTVLIDAQGRVRYRGLARDELALALRALLAEAPTPR